MLPGNNSAGLRHQPGDLPPAPVFLPHWLAIATIILAALAYGFAHFRKPRRFWLRGHIISTVLTYYMLIAGGVNEVFLRVTVLRRLSGGFPSPANGMTHFALIGLTLVVPVWFNIKYSGNPGRRVAGHGRPVQDSA